MADLFSQCWSNADPVTSEEAGRRITASGKRAHHAAIVLELVKLHPNSTYVELCFSQPPSDTQLEAVEIMRRLNDLRLAGKVDQGQKRACRIKGSTMVTWRAIDQKQSNMEG